MRIFPKPSGRDKTLTTVNNKWIKGLNTLVSNTQIRPDELSEATNIQLVEDGKIQCPRDGQAYFGSTNGSRVLGISSFYPTSGTRYLLRMVGTTLQKYNSSSGGWDNLTGAAYTTGLRANMATAYDYQYICNGTDALTKTDGSTITTFTELTVPTNLAVARSGGSAGTFVYSYKVSAVNAVGETTPCAAVTDTASVDTLTTSVKMVLTWTAVTDSIGYNVYGMSATAGHTFMQYLDGNGSVTYTDDNSDTPSTVFTPLEGNSTGGQKGKYISVYKDSLFISGDANNPSRLYYTGGGDKIDDFTVNNGGGFIDISKNDGQVLTGSVVFKDSLIVFKEDSIYKFNFLTDGMPGLEQISSSVGCIANRTIVAVENDVYFLGRDNVYTLGNQQGFAFDVLRTNAISMRVRTIVESFDPAYIQNASAVYAKTANQRLVILSYTPAGSTTNTNALVYDFERDGWYKWTNINANCWTTYIDANGINYVLYGDDSSGYVKQVLTGTTDFSSVIRGYFRLRAEDFSTKSGGNLTSYKTLKDMYMVLRSPTKSITFNIIADGVTTVYSTNISTTYPSVNFGHYLFPFLLGESVGTGSTEQDNNIVRRIRNANLTARSFMYEYDTGTSGGSFTLVEIKSTAVPKSDRYFMDGETLN
jgi:hypothetical protein